MACPNFQIMVDKIMMSIRGTILAEAFKKIKEKLLKWYGHVRRMKEEHVVRRMLYQDKEEGEKLTATPATQDGGAIQG